MRISGLLLYLFSLTFFLFVLAAANIANAKAPSNWALHAALNKLGKENAALQEQVLNQQQLQDQLLQSHQMLQQQVTQLGHQLEAQQQAQTSNDGQAERLRFRVASAVILLLVAGMLWLWWRMHKMSLASQENAASSRQQAAHIEKELANLQESVVAQTRQALHVKQALAEVKKKSEAAAGQLRDSLAEVQDNIRLAREQKTTASAQLAKIVQKPVDGKVTQNEIFSVEQLIDDGGLDFVHTLKAKGFLAEQLHDREKALSCWNLYLDETGPDNEALLHIACLNYRLAERDSKNTMFIDRATEACEAIMSSAPEYFEDACGLDDQLVGPDTLEQNGHELPIYQQVEQLVFKIETLRNYQAIYNLACKYAAQDRLEEARDCLEQVSSIFQIPNHEQLLQDEDLLPLRELDWFKQIVRQAQQQAA